MSEFINFEEDNWHYAMVGNITHAIAYCMHAYVVCIDIPDGYMTISLDHVVCLFYNVACLFEKDIESTRWFELLSSTK